MLCLHAKVLSCVSHDLSIHSASSGDKLHALGMTYLLLIHATVWTGSSLRGGERAGQIKVHDSCWFLGEGLSVCGVCVCSVYMSV